MIDNRPVQFLFQALATYQIVNKQIEQSGNSSSTVLKDDSTEQKANNGWYDS